MNTDFLPRSSPADQGVDSAGIAAFLDVLDAAPDIELHSVMLLRHGHVIAEGWWSPYGPDQVHLLYSLSKSFTSTAAGLAAAEGLLSFDEPVISYFPELAEAVTHPWTRAMRVHHLAAMATGHREDTLDRAYRLDREEPVRGFLALDPDLEPGSVFAYNNGATFVLGAIVQRVTGMTLTAYLQPRLLDPLGIAPPYWHTQPGSDRELGFSGLHLTTEAVARFGQLYLDDGVWHGRRLLPPGWVAEASRLHTPNPAEPNPDWQRGYGYQFWRSKHGYRGDGAFGQFCLVLPDHDAVLVATAQTENMQGVLDAVWSQLLPAIGGTPTLSSDGGTTLGAAGDTRAAEAALADRLSQLALAPGADTLGAAALAPETQSRIEPVGVEPDPAGGWQLALTDGRDQVTVRCGDGQWQPNSILLPTGRRLEIAATAYRRDSGGDASSAELTVQLIFVQTPHRLVLTFDPATGASTSRWMTVPLHAPTFAQLATAVPG